MTWQRVRAEVRRRVTDRVWRPGERIPIETELARELGCSRSTVNRALRALAEEGLLERRRKGGTRVTKTPEARAKLSVPLIRIEIEARSARHTYRVLRRERSRAPAAVRARLGIAGERRLLHIETLHLADERPFVLEDRWVDPVAVPALLDVDLERVSANEWLVDHVPLSRGDIAFSAEGADPVTASSLEVEPGTALFVVERTTWREETGITCVRLSYRPGHRVETTL